MQRFSKLLCKLGNIFKVNKTEPPEEDMLPLEEGFHRERYDFSDSMQREQYIRSCLEQLKEASTELEELGREYETVTMYLTDMERIQDMRPELFEDLKSYAVKITELEADNEKYQNRKSSLSEEEYASMERIEEFMPEAYNKIKEAEEYQVLIKRDLARLDGEKQAYKYRRTELVNGQSSMKGMTLICLSSMSFLIIILAILSSVLQFDVSFGVIIAVLVVAAALTLLYVKYNEATKEIHRIDKASNKLVLLHNTVKIRYVNNTNLLDYLYAKYGVQSAKSLKKQWDKYIEEANYRKVQEETKSELDFAKTGLLKLLRRAKLEEPNVWIYQLNAILNEKDMTSMRHGLILQRTNLRKQLEYNARLCDDAQNQVKEIAAQYPANAEYILGMLHDYQKAI